MREILQHVKETGLIPENFVSKEETNALGDSKMDEKQLLKARKLVQDYQLEKFRIVLVDGIMLFHDQSLIKFFDVCLLLQGDYGSLKKRRENRNGYVTLEGFWKDPPDYFDKIVWPGYERNHKYLFENENIDSNLNQELLSKLHINAVPISNFSLPEMLEWSLKVIEKEIKNDSKSFTINGKAA